MAIQKSFFAKIIPFLKARYAPRGARQTYATCAEDLMVMDILKELGVREGVIYVDIGAHHPIFGNNTYLAYRDGGSGVLVEPNEDLCTIIKTKRPRDICLNVGAGRETKEVEFYAFEKRTTRSTFSKEQAHEWQQSSGQVPVVQKKKIVSLDGILNVLGDRVPDFVSIDAEGYDIEILSGFTWSKRPKLFCIECMWREGQNHTKDERDQKIYEIMKQNDYLIEAQTRNNTLFIDKSFKK